MNYALQRSKILNRINKSRDLNAVLADQQTQNNNPKMININLNDRNRSIENYLEESKSLLANYISNSNAVDELVDDLYQSNERYIKDLVLHWTDIYEPLIKRFSGSSVSLLKIKDVLTDKLDEELKKKDIAGVSVKGNVDTHFFFENNRLKHNLLDNYQTLRDTLADIFSLNRKSVRDAELQKEMSEMTDQDTINIINDYRKSLLEKDAIIKDIIGQFVYPVLTKDIENLITDTNDALKKRFLRNIFDETLKVSQKWLNEDEIKKVLDNSNAIFVDTMKIVMDSSHYDFDFINKENEETYKKEKKREERRDSSVGIDYGFRNALKEALQDVNKRIHVETNGNILVSVCKILGIKLNKKEIEYLETTSKKKDMREGKKDTKDKYSKMIKTYFDNENDNYFTKLWNSQSATSKKIDELESLFKALNTPLSIRNKMVKLFQDKDENEKEGHGLKTGRGIAGLPSHKMPLQNKYYIDKKLLDNGILDIRYIKNGHKVGNLSHNSVLSHEAKGIIKDMISGGTISSDNFVHLNSFEKDIIRRFNNHYLNEKYHLKDDDGDLLHKNFQVLLGEWNSGNNNSLVKKQIESYIDHAIDLGKLSHHQGRKMKNAIFYKT